MDQHRALSASRPPLLLAVESATARLDVALLRGDELVAERSADAPGHHAERILSVIDALLGAAGVSIGDVEAFAVSIGPGSFTSLRVGLATVKGLAFGSDAPIVAVPTLEALAFGARREGDRAAIAALLDARRGELYAAVFESTGTGLRALVEDGLFLPEALVARLPPGCRLVGEGAPLLADALPARALAGFRLPDSGDLRALAPLAQSVGRLAAERLRRGDVAAIDLAPRYLRRAEAEAARTASAVEDPR